MLKPVEQPDDWGRLTHSPTKVYCPACSRTLALTKRGFHCWGPGACDKWYVEISLYRLDEVTWYAGESADECYRQYSKDTGMSLEELKEDNEEYPETMGPVAMMELTFFDSDGSSRSFAMQLAKMIGEGVQFPCIFATTEY